MQIYKNICMQIEYEILQYYNIIVIEILKCINITYLFIYVYIVYWMIQAHQ
jgi:hypothetical protein